MLRYLARLEQAGYPADTFIGLKVILDTDKATRALDKLGLRAHAHGRASAGSMTSVLSELSKFAALRSSDEETKAYFEEQAKIFRKLSSRLLETRARSTKNRQRLAPLKHERNLAILFLLPFALQKEVDKLDKPKRADALMMQWAVALMILMFCPLRIDSLCSLRLDKHLRWSRPGMRGSLNLEFGDGELKNGESATLPLPVECARIIRAYVVRYKALLSPSHDVHLFPGEKCEAPKRSGVLSTQLKKLIFARLGFDVNAHLYRHVVHLVVLKRYPGAYGMIARILTHKSINTAMRNYAEYDASLSVAAYADLVRQVQVGICAAPSHSVTARMYNFGKETSL